jgi:hypothetical protein
MHSSQVVEITWLLKSPFWVKSLIADLAKATCSVGQNRGMMASWQAWLREWPCAEKPDGLGAAAVLVSPLFHFILQVNCVAGRTLQG